MLPRTSRTILSVLLGGCLLAAVGVEAKPNAAAPLATQADYDRMCKAEGEYSNMVAQARDAGVPLTTVFNNLRQPKGKNKAMFSPEQRAITEKLILGIYDTATVTPVQWQREVERACLTSAARPQE